MPGSEHESATQIVGGVALAGSDQQADHGVAAGGGEEESAAGAMVPTAGGLTIRPHAAGVVEARHADLAGNQEEGAEDRHIELGPAVQAAISRVALRGQATDRRVTPGLEKAEWRLAADEG